jgi:hypothetical protein
MCSRGLLVSNNACALNSRKDHQNEMYPSPDAMESMSAEGNKLADNPAHLPHDAISCDIHDIGPTDETHGGKVVHHLQTGQSCDVL